jgi:hypothetical protein
MTWAERLKRAFNIDIKICEACDGAVKLIACIEDSVVIHKILDYLRSQENKQMKLPASRAPSMYV